MKIVFPLLAACVIGGCASTSQPISANTVYRPNMKIQIGDQEYFGSAVLDHPAEFLPKVGVSAGDKNKAALHFELSSKGKLDLFTAETCAREDFAEKLGSDTEYTFMPSPLEASYCPLEFSGFDQKGRHSFGFVDFQDSATTLPAQLDCNAKSIRSKGVSVCVLKAGKELRLAFAEPVKYDPDTNCRFAEISSDPKVVHFAALPGKCVYAFKGSSGVHRLTVIGYEKILLQEQ